MSYGVEALEAAHSKLKQTHRSEEERESELQHKKRVSLLGKTLVRQTIQKLPHNQNGVTLTPKLKRRQAGGIAVSLGVAPDYPLHLLELSALGDQTSGWMNYTLSLKDCERIDFNAKIAEFHASMNEYLSGLGLGYVETHLALYEDNQPNPVGFQSPQYDFIRTVSGLFLPDVLTVLEGEKL